jgi:hypothetical protein
MVEGLQTVYKFIAGEKRAAYEGTPIHPGGEKRRIYSFNHEE